MTKKKKILSIVLLSLLTLLICLTAVHLIGDNYAMDYAMSINAQSVNDGVSFAKSADGSPATVTTDDGTLKILQLSDIHIVASLFTRGTDRQALDAVNDIVTATRPDLVIITGDMTYSTPPLGNVDNSKAYKALATLMEKFEIPWTVTYGNHDQDPFNFYNTATQTEYYSSLEHCLLYSADVSEGEGNHIVMFNNGDGSANTALFMLDCRGYSFFPFKYAHIGDAQAEWYKESVTELNNVQSLVFTHTPLYEYRTALSLYKSGSDEVQYLHGAFHKRVASSDTAGKMFQYIVELGSTKAVFCGHDHTDNWALKYKGVALCYGMSIDCIAYPGIALRTEQRGGRLIEIDSDGTITLSLVPQTNNYQPTQPVVL